MLSIYCLGKKTVYIVYAHICALLFSWYLFCKPVYKIGTCMYVMQAEGADQSEQ